jgi:MFS family permease
MYGAVGAFFLFLVAMAIITIGEMFVAPVGQAIVARLAPEDMRGRYMAVNGFTWLIPFAIGPLLAGLIIDNFDPRILWYLAGTVGLIAAGVFYSLQWRADKAKYRAIDDRLDIMESLELGRITAEEASRHLKQVNEGVWMRLTAPEEAPETRHVRIKVSHRASQIMKSDLRIPMGLVNAVLYAGGSLSDDLAGIDRQVLKSLISESATSRSSRRMATGEDDIDVTIE